MKLIVKKNTKIYIIIILLSIFIFLPQTFYSNEISIGVRTGLGMSGNITTPKASTIYDFTNGINDNSSGSRPIFSFNSGFMAGFLFSNSNFGFELQVNYIFEGSSINNELTNNKERLEIKSLDIVIPFKMSLFARILPSNDVHYPYLLIGPVFTIPLSSKLNETQVKTSFNSLGFGFTFGIGGRLRLDNKNIFFVEISSRFILTDRLKTRGELRNYGIYFNIGYELILTGEKWDK